MKRLAIATAMVLTAVFAAPAFAGEEEFIEQIQGYLEISEKFLALANRKDAAIFFAAEGIVEIHEERGVLTPALLKRLLVDKSRFAADLGVPWTHVVETGSVIAMQDWTAADGQPVWEQLRHATRGHLTEEAMRGKTGTMIGPT